MSDRKFFVAMTDKQMSGTGNAYRKIAKVVIECDNLEQAKHIEANAKARREMMHVSLRNERPEFDSKNYYVTEIPFDKLGKSWKGK